MAERKSNRTPQEIAADEAASAFSRIERAVKRVTKAEEEVVKAKAEVGRVQALARYATQHPDIPETVRAEYAAKLDALDAELKSTEDAEDGVIDEPLA